MSTEYEVQHSTEYGVRRGKKKRKTVMPNVQCALSRRGLSGGPSIRADDEQQLLMRWVLHLFRPFIARIVGTSNQILHQKYLLDKSMASGAFLPHLPF